jgi:hypothetical protein
MDLVEKINDKTIRENERNNYIFRLEATVSYISEALQKSKFSNPVRKNNFSR